MSDRGSYPVSVIIPVFGAPAQLEACLRSLVLHAPSVSGIIVADDATPQDVIRPIVENFRGSLPNLIYVRREVNLGFVQNCNAAMESVLGSGDDVLLLNSDTEITPGAIEEMFAVLHLHEKHGAVTPRSNNATIYSIPVLERFEPQAAFSVWSKINRELPRFQVMPTSVGFCLLLRNRLLRDFGLFDPVYGPGYNEENDLICRVNRFGYSAVCANWAFVFHYESSSFGSRKRELEARNRTTLLQRYPEYERKVRNYLRWQIDPVDYFAALWGTTRKRVLFDLYHLPAKHSGTSEFALNLLARLAPLLVRKYDLWLGLSEEARSFFGPELVGYQFLEGARPSTFDLVYKPCQLFAWADFARMVRRGGRIAISHLDIIAARCDYLAGPNVIELFRAGATFSDRVFTISEFSRTDFATFYGCPADMRVIHLGTSLEANRALPSGDYVLVIGNSFAHKAVRLAIDALGNACAVIALGGDGAEPDSGRVRYIRSGNLPNSRLSDLYTRAKVVVYPSLYEGFGLPIMDALALGRPVVAIDTAVNREIQALTQTSLLHLVPTVRDIGPRIDEILSSDPVHASCAPLRSWDDVAGEYYEEFEKLLSSDLNVELLRLRWAYCRTLDAYHELPI